MAATQVKLDTLICVVKKWDLRLVLWAGGTHIDDYATSFPVFFGFQLGCIYILGIVNTSFDGHMKNIEGFFFFFQHLSAHLFSHLSSHF